MKTLTFAMLLVLGSLPLWAQFSRLHVKSPSDTLGITAGSAPNKVIGISHDGDAGIISATTLDGEPDYTPLKFVTAGEARLTIFENGFVGVGVAGTPTAELTVGGKVHAREVKVNVNAGGAPDYVFQENYYLRPLSELSSFSGHYRHLPEIPPAVEIEGNGINLSEMNMLLLKKVEELTLYLIDQDKKIKNLEIQIENLQKR